MKNCPAAWRLLERYQSLGNYPADLRQWGASFPISLARWEYVSPKDTWSVMVCILHFRWVIIVISPLLSSRMHIIRDMPWMTESDISCSFYWIYYMKFWNAFQPFLLLGQSTPGVNVLIQDSMISISFYTAVNSSPQQLKNDTFPFFWWHLSSAPLKSPSALIIYWCPSNFLQPSRKQNACRGIYPHGLPAFYWYQCGGSCPVSPGYWQYKWNIKCCSVH